MQTQCPHCGLHQGHVPRCPYLTGEAIGPGSRSRKKRKALDDEESERDLVRNSPGGY